LLIFVVVLALGVLVVVFALSKGLVIAVTLGKVTLLGICIVYVVVEGLVVVVALGIVFVVVALSILIVVVAPGVLFVIVALGVHVVAYSLSTLLAMGLSAMVVAIGTLSSSSPLARDSSTPLSPAACCLCCWQYHPPWRTLMGQVFFCRSVCHPKQRNKTRPPYTPPWSGILSVIPSIADSNYQLVVLALGLLANLK
jgi:hypothetical protein